MMKDLQNYSVKDVAVMNDWVFIDPEKSSSEDKGIVLPQSRDELATKGVIVALKAKKGDKVAVLDHVLFKQNAAFGKIEFQGDRYLVLKKNQILATLENDTALGVRPIEDYLFIEWEEAPAFYGNTNLIRPDSYKANHYTGLVVAVGGEVKDLKKGDRIFFDQFCGVQPFNEDQKRYAIIHRGGVFCKVNFKRDKKREASAPSLCGDAR